MAHILSPGSLLAGLVLSTAVLLGTSASASNVSLVARHSGKCLQVQGVPANGVKIVQAPCTGAANQTWSAIPFSIQGQMAYFMSDGRGKSFALDARNYNNMDDRSMVLWEFGTKVLTQWWNTFSQATIDGHEYDSLVTLQTGSSCVGVDRSSQDDGAAVQIQDCQNLIYQQFASVQIDRSKFVSNEPISCRVFDDGYANQEGPSDAIFISGRTANNEQGKACVPGGPYGHCHKWFGRCSTTQTFQSVAFKVFNDGTSSLTGTTDAIYAMKSGSKLCIPDGTGPGTCRKWFGEGQTRDGRRVSCKVFDDGYANASAPSDAIYIPSPIPSAGAACMPDGTGRGTCRRWFGQCATQ